jgi:hypothetical protein
MDNSYVSIGIGNNYKGTNPSDFEFVNEKDNIKCMFYEADFLRSLFFEKPTKKDAVYLPEKIIDGIKNTSVETSMGKFALEEEISRTYSLVVELLILAHKAQVAQSNIGFLFRYE